MIHAIGAVKSWKPMVAHLLRAVWVGLAGIVLGVAQFAFDGRPNSDADLFLVGTMLVLTFPAGMLFAFAVGIAFEGLHLVFGIDVATTRLSMLAEWVGFFAVGYLQWFALLPRVVARFRTHSDT